MQKMHTCMHAHASMRACTHPHPGHTQRGEGQCCLTEIFWEEECLEFAFEERESSKVPDVLQDRFLHFYILYFGDMAYHWPTRRTSRSPRTAPLPRDPSPGQGSPSRSAPRCSEGRSGTGTWLPSPGATRAEPRPARCCPSERSRPHPAGRILAVRDALRTEWKKHPDAWISRGG